MSYNAFLENSSNGIRSSSLLLKSGSKNVYLNKNKNNLNIHTI